MKFLSELSLHVRQTSWHRFRLLLFCLGSSSCYIAAFVWLHLSYSSIFHPPRLNCLWSCVRLPLLLQPFLSGPPSAFTFSSLSLSLIPCLSLSSSPHFMQCWGYLRDWASMEKISFGTMNWVRGRGEGRKKGVSWGGVGHRRVGVCKKWR